MRAFINAVTEGWNIGEPFHQIDGGSRWFRLASEEEIDRTLQTLNIRNGDAFTMPCFVLVHDNRPVMVASIDALTAKVDKAALQSGIEPDAGWSHFLTGLEQKIAGTTEEQPMESAPAPSMKTLLGLVR